MSYDSSLKGLQCLKVEFSCLICQRLHFKNYDEYVSHLKIFHCAKEGGSFVCLYGQNNVCSSLPLEGVSDMDYEQHVAKHHCMSTEQSFSKAKSSCNKESERWGVFSSTQNIPAALNDPRKGIRRDFFTKLYGDTFTENNETFPLKKLPEVKPRHFESYLKRLNRRRNIQVKSDSQKREEDSIIQSIDLLSQSIPDLFLSSNFDLKNPSTFYSVFTHITKCGISKKNSRPLQEKLFNYLEMVECKMSEQIARKSHAFFDTMTYLNAQTEQLKLNHSAVLTLRKGISSLKNEVVVMPMKISWLPVKRTNIRNTIKKLEAMRTVREVQSTIQIMLTRQEYSSALDLIDTMQDLLTSELSSIKGLRHLSNELEETESLITKLVKIEFTQYVAQHLNRPFDLNEPPDQVQLLAVFFAVLRLKKFDYFEVIRNEFTASIDVTIKHTIAETVSQSEASFQSRNQSENFFQNFSKTNQPRGSSQNHLKLSSQSQTVKQNFSDSKLISDQLQSLRQYFDQLNLLNTHQWLNLFKVLTSRLLSIMHRAHSLVEIMGEAVKASAGRSSCDSKDIVTYAAISHNEQVLSVEMCDQSLTKLKSSLFDACDLSHGRCARVLHARSKDERLEKTSANEFLLLSKIVDDFTNETQRLTTRIPSDLRMSLQGQASRFVARFHEERETRLKSNLKSERWKAIHIPSDFQQLIDRVIESGFFAASKDRNGPDILNIKNVGKSFSGETQSSNNFIENNLEKIKSSAVSNSVSVDSSLHSSNLGINSKLDQSTVINTFAEVSNANCNSFGNDFCTESDSSQATIDSAFYDSDNITNGLNSDKPSFSIRRSNILNDINKDSVYTESRGISTKYSGVPINSRNAPTDFTKISINSGRFPVNSGISTNSSLIIPNSTSISSKPNINSQSESNLIALSQSSQSLASLDSVPTAGGDSVPIGVVVNQNNYVIVGVCVVVIRLIVEYSECANLLPMASSQLLNRLIDLLKKFNADTCRLLVEAGAVSLGLKTITTRHLALGLRSLELILIFIHKLKPHFEKLGLNNVDKNVNQLILDYKKHCDAITSKIVLIADNSMEQFLSTWVARSPVPSNTFISILKIMSKLHETLSSILPQSKVEEIFNKITINLRRELNRHIKRLGVSNLGPQSWVVMSELTFYFNHIADLGVKLNQTQDSFIQNLWNLDNS